MRTLAHDLREAARALRRNARFTSLCAAVLGVGIGLSAAMFTALNAVVLRKLPVVDQDRVVVSWGVNESRQFNHLPLTVSQWRRFAERSRTLERVAAADYNGSWPLFVREGERAYPIRRGLVSGDFFQALGAKPELGRLLEPGDDRVGAAPVAVVSHGYWRRQFGGEPSVVGRRLTFHGNGLTVTIVGVAPQGLEYPVGTELWMPIIPTSTVPPADTSYAAVDVVGRLRPGATAQAMADELTAFLRDPSVWSGREAGEAMRDARGTARTLPELLLGDVSRELTVLGIAVGLLLLVACVNVAGLLLMRGAERGREVALRMAVGASAGRVVRRQVAEGLVLAVIGGAVGVALAWSTLGMLRWFAPAQLPRLEEIRTDVVAVAAALAIAMVTAVLFTTGPAVVAARTDAGVLLRAGARAAGAGRGVRRFREGLVAAQVAVAVVVLAAATLVARSFRELQRADLGYVKENVVVADLAWDFTQVPDPARSLAVYDEMLPRVRAVPGVVAASAALLTPFSGTGGWDGLFTAADRPATEQGNNPWLNMEVVSPSYFDVFRIPLRAGRVFTDADREGAPRAILLSEGAARALWPDGQALGRQVRPAWADTTLWTVVGVVADTRYRDYRRPRETIYFAHHQSPFPVMVTMLAFRTSADPLGVLPAVREAVRQSGPGLLVARAATMETYLDTPLAQPRFNALLLATFAGAALLMVGAGLYAVLAFAVRLRARELAIRAAVGAAPAALRGLVVRASVALVGVGLVIGLVAAAAGTRLLRSMLYGVSPTDPVSIAAGVALLLVVALAATLVPTRWASRTSAAELLRSE